MDFFGPEAGLSFFLIKKKQKIKHGTSKNYQLSSPNFRKQNNLDTVELFSTLVPRLQTSQGVGSSFLADGPSHDVNIFKE
jgi:hypothetical protein